MAAHSLFPSSFLSLSSYRRPNQPWLLRRPPMAAHSLFPSSFLSLSPYRQPNQPWLLRRPPIAAHSLFPSSFLSLSPYRRSNQPCLQRRPPALIVCRVSTRKSRKLLSDEDLCKGLKEFVSSVGLPSSHVPSMKELTEHGRMDLAYIVRRRGYRAIKDLLSKYNDIANGSEIEDVRTEEDVSSHLQDDTAGQKDEGFLCSTKGVSSYENHLDLKIESGVHLEAESLISSGSQDASSFKEKVERFLNHGELETAEDNTGKDFWVDEAIGNEVYGESSRSPALAIDDHAAANATSVLSNSAANLGAERNQMSGPSSEVPADFNLDEDDIAKSKVRNQVEVDRLTFLLHQKELELSQLKEEIEKEKQALFELQAKAENEINKAQELVLEKDAELLAAEESLSGLKEVEIQYRGEGEIVEVSGSFNGWHQRIKLDPLASSTNSRNPRLWSLTLWLYPGKYEIKFIVDGQWRIDPRRETTKRGGIENNILRVDR